MRFFALLLTIIVYSNFSYSNCTIFIAVQGDNRGALKYFNAMTEIAAASKLVNVVKAATFQPNDNISYQSLFVDSSDFDHKILSFRLNSFQNKNRIIENHLSYISIGPSDEHPLIVNLERWSEIALVEKVNKEKFLEPLKELILEAIEKNCSE